jgi:hypothetical protein
MRGVIISVRVGGHRADDASAENRATCLRDAVGIDRVIAKIGQHTQLRDVGAQLVACPASTASSIDSSARVPAERIGQMPGNPLVQGPPGQQHRPASSKR